MKYILPLFLILFACEREPMAPVSYPNGLNDNILQYDTLNVEVGKTYSLCLYQHELGRIIVSIKRLDQIKINFYSFDLGTQTGWQFQVDQFYFNDTGLADVNILFYEAMPIQVDVWRNGEVIKTVILR